LDLRRLLGRLLRVLLEMLGGKLHSSADEGADNHDGLCQNGSNVIEEYE
jgi:hypothetical protein